MDLLPYYQFTVRMYVEFIHLIRTHNENEISVVDQEMERVKQKKNLKGQFFFFFPSL